MSRTTCVCNPSAFRLRVSVRSLAAVSAALLLAVAVPAARADVDGPGVGQDFFNVNGVNGNITINEGTSVTQDLRLRINGETNASGFAGTTTHRFNGNTITFSRSGPSGGTSLNQGAGGGGVTQDFFGSSFYYGQDGAHTVSFNQNFSLHTTENSSFGLGTNNIDWNSGQSNSRTITVLNVAPNIINATINGTNGNVTVNEGSTVALQMQSGDPGDDTAIFTINGAFGNAGTVNQAGHTTRTSNVVNQTFNNQGVFNLGYQVDDDDTSTSTTRTLTVNNVLPTIVTALQNGINGNITINEGDNVARQMSATDPGADFLSFFIDGNAAGVGGNSPGSTRNSSTDNFVYVDEGVFNSFFDVFDDVGSVNITRQVTVLNVAPTLTSVLPGNVTVNKNQPLAFSATAFDPGVLDVLTFNWDFDFTGVFNIDFTGPNGVLPGFYYPTQGVYTWKVIVDDGDGGTDEATFTVTVVPEPSTIALAGLGVLGLLALRRRLRR